MELCKPITGRGGAGEQTWEQRMQGNAKLKSRPGGSGGVRGACLLVGASSPEEMAAETHSFTQHTIPISYRLFDPASMFRKENLVPL